MAVAAVAVTSQARRRRRIADATERVDERGAHDIREGVVVHVTGDVVNNYEQGDDTKMEGVAVGAAEPQPSAPARVRASRASQRAPASGPSVPRRAMASGPC